MFFNIVDCARGGLLGPPRISGIPSETRKDPDAVVRASGNLSEGNSEFRTGVAKNSCPCGTPDPISTCDENRKSWTSLPAGRFGAVPTRCWRTAQLGNLRLIISAGSSTALFARGNLMGAGVKKWSYAENVRSSLLWWSIGASLLEPEPFRGGEEENRSLRKLICHVIDYDLKYSIEGLWPKILPSGRKSAWSYSNIIGIFLSLQKR